MNRFVRFALVGAGGFLVDFAAMSGFLTLASLPPLPARLIAFAITVCVTYVFNRVFTFADRPRRGRQEWIAYALTSCAAALVNLGVFSLTLSALHATPMSPYIAMPLGVAAGLAVNFVCYNFFVFRAASREQC